MNYHTVI